MVQVHILPTGATLQRVLVPGRKIGEMVDVVLGFDDEESYRVRCVKAGLANKMLCRLLAAANWQSWRDRKHATVQVPVLPHL